MLPIDAVPFLVALSMRKQLCQAAVRARKDWMQRWQCSQIAATFAAALLQLQQLRGYEDLVFYLPFQGKEVCFSGFSVLFIFFFPTINLFVEIIFYCSFYTKLKIGNFLRAHKKISVSVIWHLGTSSNGYNLPIL